MKWEKRRIASMTELLLRAGALVTVLMIVAMHIAKPPTLEPFRAPADLRRISSLWGPQWPESFRLYHLFLGLIALNFAGSLIGLRRLDKLRGAFLCQASALLGLSISVLIFLFYFLQLTSHRDFTRLDVESAVIFAVYGAVLLVANVLLCVVGFGSPALARAEKRIREET